MENFPQEPLNAQDESRHREKLARFVNLAPPPRAVPLSLRLALILTPVCLLGAVFFAFGMIFVKVFVDFPGLRHEWRLFTEAPVTVAGKVTGVDKTQYREGGSRHNPGSGTPVYRYAFEFQLGGKSYLATSYSTGLRFAAGQAVPVQCLEADPGVAKIQGTRCALLGWPVLIVLFFPLTGAGITLSALLGGLKAARLLSQGELGEATVTQVREIPGKNKDKPFYDLTFTFTPRFSQATSFKVRTQAKRELTDEPREIIFYNPYQPRQAVPLDALPARAEIGPDRQWQPAPWLPVTLKLLVVMACYGYAGFGHFKI